MPTLNAIIRCINTAALRGDSKAQKLALDYSRQAAQDEERIKIANANARLQEFHNLLTYKTECRLEIKLCERVGRSPPDMVPHPDDIVIDEVAEVIIFNGPRDECEQQEWDRQRAWMADSELETSSIVSFEKKHPGFLEGQGEHLAELRDEIYFRNIWYPDEETRRRPTFRLATRRADPKAQRLLAKWRLKREGRLAHESANVSSESGGSDESSKSDPV